jgi:hypothetical protein
MKRIPATLWQLLIAAMLVGSFSASAESTQALQLARYRLTAVGGSGIQGSVLLADYGLGNTVVTILLSGTRATADYPAYIRAGRCEAGGEALYPLEAISGSLGLSVSIVDATFDALIGGDYHIAIHRSPRNLATIVACGDIGLGAEPITLQRTEAPPAPAPEPEPTEVAPPVVVEPEPVEAEPEPEPAADTITIERRIVQNAAEAGERFSSNDAVEFGAFVNDNYPEDATWVDNYAIALTYYAAAHEDGRVREYGPLNAVGLRFTELDIPAGATITEAYLELTAKASRSDAVSIIINAQRDPNASAFVDQELGNISTRPRSFARHTWLTRDWTAGERYRSGDLSALVQEVVNLDGWQSGNAIVLILTSASTTNWQEAHSYRSGSEAEHPRLVVRFEPP